MSKMEQLYDLIIKLTNEIKQFDDEHSQDFTLNAADVNILKLLRLQDQTIASLTKNLSYDKAFISRRVSFLDNNGLLKKIPLNRKSNMLEITLLGKSELKKVQNKVDQMYQGILTDAEIDVLLEIGSKVQHRIVNQKKDTNKGEKSHGK